MKKINTEKLQRTINKRLKTEFCVPTFAFISKVEYDNDKDYPVVFISIFIFQEDKCLLKDKFAVLPNDSYDFICGMIIQALN